jgi:hypothetical protein
MTVEEYQPYDKSSKWLIQHHGDSMLRLAKIGNVEAWRAAQAEVVQPRQLPDGLLEVRLQGEARDGLFLLEVAAYPERRVGTPLTRDLMLVYLGRGELPEGLTLVLRPKGKYRVPGRRRLGSRHGFSSCILKWRVVELWTMPAEELLAAQDVGLIPWVPLTDFTDAPETMIRRCRAAIEQHAPADEKANLLAVTQVLMYLRYNDVGLLTILGGTQAMIESPLIDQLFKERYGQQLAEEVRQTARQTARETAHRAILTVLEARFGQVPRDLAEDIESVADENRLTDLVCRGATCPDLEAFRDEIERR